MCIYSIDQYNVEANIFLRLRPRISEDPLRFRLIHDTVMHQRVTRVFPYDNVANCAE